MMSAQRKKIKDFRGIVDCTEKVAKDFLKRSEWDVNSALDRFYNESANAPISSEPDRGSSLNSLFDSFQDPEHDGVCLGEALQAYLRELGVDPNAKEALGVLWLVNAQDVGVITRNEFVQGWASRGVNSLDGMKRLASSLSRTLGSPDSNDFRDFYKYLFDLLREDQKKRTIPAEMGLQVWKIVFDTQKMPLAGALVSFLEKREDFRVMTRDVWNQSLFFLVETKLDFSNYDEDGAWPTVIDDFVNSQRRNPNGVSA